MKLGFIGLGKMGGGMSRRLARAGIEVHGFAPSEESRANAAKAGVITHASRDEMLVALGDDAIVWLMIPAQFVKQEVHELIEILPEGGIIVEGGNSRFRQSVQLSASAEEAGIYFIDIGVSGGQVGENVGYCTMAGGDKDAYESLTPYLQELCQENGYGHFGKAGAGHYIKMVHNAIEYGMMEAYAEGYQLVKDGPFKDVDMARLSEVWQHGSIIVSFLNSLVVDIMKSNPTLDGIDGKVNMLGEAQWADEFAQEIGTELHTVHHAIEKRAESQQGKVTYGTKLLAALRNAFGGHSLNKISADQEPGGSRNV